MQPLQHWDNIHRDFRESRLATAQQQANCEGDNCHLSLRALAINRSLVALRRPRPAYQTPYPPPAVLRAPPSAMSIVRRRRRGPVIGSERRRVQPAIAPPSPAGDPTTITWAKSRVSIKTQELRLSTRECDLPEIKIPILDYCNALFSGTAKGQVKRLQAVQNAAARLMSGGHPCDHVMPLLCNLY